jgi:ankyrin repeat protein
MVGSFSSTSFHFAAASGHTNVVRTLLLQDAHADLVHKHGVTLEILARENGKEGTVEMLREWLGICIGI